VYINAGMLMIRMVGPSLYTISSISLFLSAEVDAALIHSAEQLNEVVLRHFQRPLPR
jgi:hypothetical protein